MAGSTLTDALRDTLDVFEPAGAPLSTPEVANQLDLGRRSTYERLERLVDQGHLQTKKVGASARVWWRPPSSEDDTNSETAEPADHHQFDSLVDAVEEYAIFMLDAEGHIQTWNPGARRIKGYTEADIVGEHFSTFYTDDDRADNVPKRDLKAAAHMGEIKDEGWRVRADGTTFRANVTITAIRDDDGDLQGFAKATRDMTDRREHEEQLRQERNFTQRVLDTAPVGVVLLQEDGTFTSANQRADELLGLDGAGPHDIDDNEVLDEDGDPLPPAERPYMRVFDTGDPVRNAQLNIPTGDGDRRWISANAEPLEEDGTVEQVLVSIEDISQLKHQAERLQRERDQASSELDDIFERVDDAFFAVDTDWRFTYVNDTAAEVVGLSAAEMLGSRVWDTLPEVAEGRPRAQAERAMGTGKSTQFEFYSELLDIWVEVRLFPSGDGLSVYFRDITERKERERELEQYETIVSTMQDGVYVLDGDFKFVKVNDAYVEMTGYDREELLGTHCSLVVDDEVTAESAWQLEEMLTGAADSGTIEADIHRADETTLRAESRFTAVDDESQEGTRKVGVVRDVSDRVAREQELAESRRRYQTLVENFPNGAVALVDEDLRYQTVGGTPLDVGGDGADDFAGQSLQEILPPDLTELLSPRYEDALNGEASTFEAELDEGWFQFQIVPVRDDDDEEFAALGMSQDITQRKESERQLRARVRQQHVVADLGQDALESQDLHALFADATEVIADTLDNEYCEVLDLDADSDELHLRQGVGWDEGIVGTATVSAVEADSQAAFTLASRGPVIVDDLTTETRFSGLDLLTDHDVQSGISVIIGPHDDPRGILGTHDTQMKAFSEHDVNFVQAVAHILATAIDRHEHEHQIVRTNEQLAALNNINEVVREITDAIIEQSTRAEIEQTTCEHLADADSYLSAWIGEVDSTTETVTPRAEDGMEGYLDDVTISVDPDDDHSDGPTDRAFRTGEIQVTQDIAADDQSEPWRDHAARYGVRSSASIPIVHEETVYGVLNVYADRPDAFTGQERAVIAQLGEIVGHAIAATERKQALMSDELIELAFRVENVFETLGLDPVVDGPIRLDHTVQVGDNAFLLFGSASAECAETVRAMVETVPFYEDVTIRDQDDEIAFEIQSSEPPVLSTVASLGGSVEEAVIEEGDFDFRIYLAPSVDVREVIDAVEAAYPTAQMVRRQQITRPRDDPQRLHEQLVATLTERQRTALETAHHAGFFEWPRDASGEDVAESLGVASPTFHQHLRKAEGKVFDELLSTDTSA